MDEKPKTECEIIDEMHDHKGEIVRDLWAALEKYFPDLVQSVDMPSRLLPMDILAALEIVKMFFIEHSKIMTNLDNLLCCDGLGK